MPQKRVIAGTALTALILAAVQQPASAQSRRFQDWQTEVTTEFREAFTASDSGAVLGVLCSASSDECFAYVTTGSRCEQDAIVPVLINTDSTSHSMTTQCKALDSS